MEYEVSRKRGVLWITAISIMYLLSFLAGQSVQAQPQPQPQLNLSAEAAILMDVDTGRILFEKNSEQELRIASITKIMTAIIAIEQGDVKEMVAASGTAVGVEGSSIYLRLGEELSLEDLLYGMMLRSGNDAAVAIAEHIGGSVEGFVFLMNQKALELGMSKTMFSNPHGLDDHEQHYSTAKDMALLTAYALQNPTFAKIVATKRKNAPAEGLHRERVWLNKNKLLNQYPYADGVKTGYTIRAKRTLVSSATKDGHQLVAVTLNAPNDWQDHIAMFEYGFGTYHKVSLVQKGEKIREQGLVRTDGYFTALNSRLYPLAEDEHVQRRIVINPLFSQDKIDLDHIPNPAGYMHITLNGELIAEIPLQFIPEQKTSTSFWRHFVQVIQWVIGAEADG